MITVKLAITTAEQKLSTLLAAAGVLFSGRDGEKENALDVGYIENLSPSATVYVESGYAAAPSGTHGALAPLAALPFMRINPFQTFVKATASCNIGVVVGSPGPIFRPIDQGNNLLNVGVPSAGVLVTEQGHGAYHQTIIDLNGKAVTVGNTTGESFGGVKIYTYPKGLIKVSSFLLKSDLVIGLLNAGNLTPIIAGMGGKISFGSTVTADASPSAADIDHLAEQTLDPIEAAFAGANLSTEFVLNGLTTAAELFANFTLNDDDVLDLASDIIELNGTCVVNWEFLGAY